MNVDLSGFMTYSNVAMITLLLFIYFSYRKFKKSQKNKDGEKFSLSGFFVDDPVHKFEVVATISTICEIVGLTLLAIDRGVEPFNAASRYLTIGFIELMFTFLFMNITTEMIRSFFRKAYVDKKISWHEYITFPILFFIITIPLLIVCTIPTYIIGNLYFESIGVLKFNYVSHWNPFRCLESADVTNTYIDENGIMITTYPELGALILIWFNPLLNIMQLPLAFINIKREEAKKGSEEAKKPKEANIDELISQMEKYFTFVNAADLKKRLQQQTDKTNSKAAKYIIAGTVTKEDYIEKLRQELLGSSDDVKKLTGVLGYKYLYEEMEVIIKEIEKNKHKRAELDEKKKKIGVEITSIKTAADTGWEDKVEEKEKELGDLEKDIKDAADEHGSIRVKKQELETALNNLKKLIQTKLEKTGLID